jgi:beta-lactamase class A
MPSQQIERATRSGGRHLLHDVDLEDDPLRRPRGARCRREVLGHSSDGGDFNRRRWVTFRPLTTSVALERGQSHAIGHTIIRVSDLSRPVLDSASRIQDLASGLAIGISATRLSDGKHIGIREDQLFATASCIKVPILVAVYERFLAGRLNIDERIVVGRESRVAGSGVLQFLDVGLQPTLRDLTVLMVVLSDNTATDLLLERVSKRQVESLMHAYGLSAIRIPFTRREELMGLVDMNPSQPGGYDELRARLARIGTDVTCVTSSNVGTSTPRHMCRLLELLASQAILDSSSCRTIFDLMAMVPVATRIPALLPRGTIVAHKPGSLRGVRNDVGVVLAPSGPYAVAIFARDDAASVVADRHLATISLAIWEEFTNA